jgi:stage III sporulation protein AE
MRNIIIVLVMAPLLLFAVIPMGAAAESSGEEAEIAQQMNDILEESDIGYDYGELGELSFGGLMRYVRETAAARAAAPVKMLGLLVALAVFTAVMRGAGESAFPDTSQSKVYDMVCVMAAVTVIAPQLMSVYSGALEAVERVGGFVALFVPVFAGITIASGGAASGGLYNLMILGASEVIVGLSRSYLMPVLSMTAVLAISCSVFTNASVEGLVGLIKKTVTWCMTVVMTLFTGFVTMKCTLAGKADGVATKAAKFVFSGFIPIVGGAVSDAYSTVRSSFDVIRSTVGAAGMAAVLFILLPPVLEILIFRGVMWIGAATADMFGAAPLTKLLSGVDSGLAIAQSVLICYGIMFTICTGILIQTAG